MSVKNKIQELAQREFEQVVRHRHHLHSHPELSFEEVQTSLYVQQQLKSMGIAEVSVMADTGVVAMIRGQHPEKKTVALRADMDALPIQETNEVSYKSTRPGVMHACGHDVHTSCLLGAASILQQARQDFEGSIKLIFQPGEEKIPGGASLMIRDGVLQNPAPRHILGQHVMPSIPVGKVGFKPGMYMASADEIYITVKGKGGHAAMPDKNIDPILIASHILVALQQIVSRNCDPRLPCVLSFGKIVGMGATNIIPDEVKIEGTFRTMDENWRAEAKKKMKKMAEAIAEGMGGTCEFTILQGYPFLRNAEDLTHRMKAAAIDFLGEENVVDLDIWMAAEDFAFYTQQVDACFYRLGVRNEARGITSGVHTSTFDIDEQALLTGSGLMAWLALQDLRST
ncbi:MAG: M20 family metallopeptidase [Cytophagaceae bacterium]|jgi:amidohydrolase|nr:M20 family metallopeptidase [Cytophagaceae bacterium]